MASEYSDYRCQDAYEAGVRDALAELEPGEPGAGDRAWWDAERVGDWPQDRSAVYHTLREMEGFAREDVADALDQQWNGQR
jgi:hypothetical protein